MQITAFKIKNYAFCFFLIMSTQICGRTHFIGNTTISGVTVTANSGNASLLSVGILTAGLTINNATVNATAGTAEESFGVCVFIDEGLTINNGTVTMAGNDRAFTLTDGGGVFLNYTVPSGVRYWVSSNITGTPIAAEGTGSFTITSAHKWARLQRP